MDIRAVKQSLRASGLRLCRLHGRIGAAGFIDIVIVKGDVHGSWVV